LPYRGGGAQAACFGVARWLPALPAPSLTSGAPPGIMQVVWDVVAMAAVHAMVAGRKHMWSRSFAGAEDPLVSV
jgi:hypothetical protein